MNSLSPLKIGTVIVLIAAFVVLAVASAHNLGKVRITHASNVNQIASEIKHTDEIKYKVWCKVTGNITNLTREEFNVLNVDDRLIRDIDTRKLSNAEVGR